MWNAGQSLTSMPILYICVWMIFALNLFLWPLKSLKLSVYSSTSVNFEREQYIQSDQIDNLGMSCVVSLTDLHTPTSDTLIKHSEPRPVSNVNTKSTPILWPLKVSVKHTGSIRTWGQLWERTVYQIRALSRSKRKHSSPMTFACTAALYEHHLIAWSLNK